MAPVSVKAVEAFAHATHGVAFSTSTAGTALGATISAENIIPRWAFFHGAVGAGETGVALATDRARRIPRVAVLCTRVGSSPAVVAVLRIVRDSEEGASTTIIRVVGHVVGELSKRLAGSVAVAVIWAGGALAGSSSVTDSTHALAKSAVAAAPVGAFNLVGDVVIVRTWGHSPSTPEGACPQGTVSTGPHIYEHALVQVLVAGAAVLGARSRRAGPVAAAPVGAVGLG